MPGQGAVSAPSWPGQGAIYTPLPAPGGAWLGGVEVYASRRLMFRGWTEVPTLTRRLVNCPFSVLERALW
eukprot:3430761-Pyramimonas_sp.AAC.1